MVPKKLHYIWLGGEKPNSVRKCIDSFHEYLSDYEIIEWNESNIDISWFNGDELKFYNKNYNDKKYAFCSDVARLHVLKRFGGIYVDTDVEFIKHLPGEFLCKPIIARVSPDNTVCNGCIWGCEQNDSMVNKMITALSSKLKTSAKEHGKYWIFNTLLKNEFIKKGDTLNNKIITTVCGYNVYPTEYFCPVNGMTGEISITENTISIHHFDLSWKK